MWPIALFNVCMAGDESTTTNACVAHTTHKPHALEVMSDKVRWHGHAVRGHSTLAQAVQVHVACNELSRSPRSSRLLMCKCGWSEGLAACELYSSELESSLSRFDNAQCVPLPLHWCASTECPAAFACLSRREHASNDRRRAHSLSHRAPLPLGQRRGALASTPGPLSRTAEEGCSESGGGCKGHTLPYARSDTSPEQTRSAIRTHRV